MDTITQRQAWMATLAKAPLSKLEAQVKSLDTPPSYHCLRPPEIGLTMVRGRAGGTGEMFNLGEMTITRCTVQLQSVTGFGYVPGRSQRHAELAAICDALLQLPSWHEQVMTEVIKPLQAEARSQREAKQRQTAATKVDFFTLAREASQSG